MRVDPWPTITMLCDVVATAPLTRSSDAMVPAIGAVRVAPARLCSAVDTAAFAVATPTLSWATWAAEDVAAPPVPLLPCVPVESVEPVEPVEPVDLLPVDVEPALVELLPVEPVEPVGLHRRDGAGHGEGQIRLLAGASGPVALTVWRTVPAATVTSDVVAALAVV